MQAIVDAVNVQFALNAIIDQADGVADPAPTLSNFEHLGVAGVDADNLAAVNSLIAETADNGSGVNTQAEVQALINIIDQADGSAASAPSVADLQALGLTGVSAANVAAIQAAIANTADDGSGVDTLAELQALIDGVNVIIDQADGDASPAPAVEDFAAIAVSGVDAANLGAINALIADTADDASGVDSTAEVQALVSIVDQADGNAAVTPTADMFALIGVNGINAQNIDAINALIADTADDGTGVDSFAELNALAKMIDQADGQATQALTIDDFALLGISGVEDSNLAEILRAMANTANDGSGLNSIAKIQALVNQHLVAAPAEPAAAAPQSSSASQSGSSTLGSVLSSSASESSASGPATTAAVSAVSSDGEASVSDGIADVQADRLVSVGQSNPSTGVVGEAVNAVSPEQADITAQASDTFNGMVTETASAAPASAQGVEATAVAGQQQATPLDQILDDAFASVLGAGVPDQGQGTAAAEQGSDTAQDNAQAQPASEAADNAEVTNADQPAEGEPVAAVNAESWLIQMEEKRQAFEQQRQQLAEIAGSVNVA
jgi:hypothetical protein